jgi:inorganic pyrophosphatase
MNIQNIPAGEGAPDNFWVYVEIPQGSQVKYELNKEFGCIMVDRFLHTSMQYPFNYGFIPSTHAEDGDPADVLLLSSLPIAPGSLILARPIGLLEMEDEMGADNKIIAVPMRGIDPDFGHIEDMSHVPIHTHSRIKHFFDSYKQLEEGKWVKTGEFCGIERAKDEVRRSLIK